MSIYAIMEKTIFGILDGKLNLYPQNRIIDAITNRKRKNTKSLKGILSRLEQIGQKCFDARQECFNEIGKDLILCGTPEAKERYAKLVIEDMSYITLNHPIAQYDKFKSVVQHDVFGPILGLFKNENINISPFLDMHRELDKDLLSFFMSDENEIIDSEKKRDANKL